jgi:hypothetical protein
MSRAFIQLWDKDVVRAMEEQVGGGRLTHSASDKFEAVGLERGDRLYVVGLRRGQVILIGRMVVDELVDHETAVRRLQNPNIYEARWHVLGNEEQASEMRFDRLVPRADAERLERASGKRLDPDVPMTFAAVGEITPGTAETLEQVLQDVAGQDEEPPPSRGLRGEDYRAAGDGLRVRDVDLYERDPNLLDRATKAHGKTQDALAEAVRAAGLRPLSPAAGDPDFDIAWRQADVTVVAEVKSLTPANEERQLRMALGQILRYAFLLRGDQPVHRVIATERPPDDRTWERLCEALDIRLVWPKRFPQLIRCDGS